MSKENENKQNFVMLAWDTASTSKNGIILFYKDKDKNIHIIDSFKDFDLKRLKR